jgi:hypothetical protein
MACASSPAPQRGLLARHWQRGGDLRATRLLERSGEGAYIPLEYVCDRGVFVREREMPPKYRQAAQGGIGILSWVAAMTIKELSTFAFWFLIILGLALLTYAGWGFLRRKESVTPVLIPDRPIDADDHSVWWAFTVPIIILTMMALPLASKPIQLFVKSLSTVAERTIPQGSLSVGKVALQQGPQVANGRLLIQLPLKNTWNDVLGFTATVNSFKFNDSQFEIEKKSISGMLNSLEEINFQLPTIPSNLLKNDVHRFDLDFTLEYGHGNGPSQWRMQRMLRCRVPYNDFNIGKCNQLKSISERISNE